MIIMCEGSYEVGRTILLLLTHSREVLMCCLAFATSLARDDRANESEEP